MRVRNETDWTAQVRVAGGGGGSGMSKHLLGRWLYQSEEDMTEADRRHRGCRRGKARIGQHKATWVVNRSVSIVFGSCTR